MLTSPLGASPKRVRGDTDSLVNTGRISVYVVYAPRYHASHMNEQKESVTVRLPPVVKREIDHRAEASGVDRSEIMRTLLVEALSRETFERRIAAEIRSVHQRVQAASAEVGGQMDSLREALANLALVLLTRHSDEVYTPEEAQNWIKKTLLDNRP